MEPAKLNPSDPADAQLEALLREHADDVLPDNGFSQQVMARLPAAESSRRAALLPPQPGRFPLWKLSDLWTAGAASALALLLVQLTGGASADEVLPDIRVAFSAMAEAFLDPQLLLVLAITTGILLFMADDSEDRAGLERPE
jgi:hypothetical protein